MRKIQFTMAAKFLFLAVILVCGFLTASANAASEGPASALFFTYYDVRDLGDGGLGVSDNYFTVINPTSTWVQAHVRVRTGDKSVELLDFDIMLSPNDVFAFDLSNDSSAAQKGILFVSKDLKTIQQTKELSFFITDLGGGVEGVAFSTNPDSPFFSANLTSLIEECEGEDPETAGAHAQKGYVEVIAEGSILDCQTVLKGSSKPADAKHGYCAPTAAAQSAIKTVAGTPPPNPIGDRWHSLAQVLTGLKTACNATVENLINFAGNGTPGSALAIHDLATDHTDGDLGLCEKNIFRVTPSLVGRVYYASVAPDKKSVSRLSTANAEGVDNQLDSLCNEDSWATCHHIIIHEDNYTDELNNVRCTAGNGNEHCFAYTAASTNNANQLDDPTVQGGANDMNFCFYQDTINDASDPDDGLGVQNKFGAAATFGPTLADLPEQRDGDVEQTANNLIIMITDSSLGNLTANGLLSIPAFLKSNIYSHFFNTPAPGDFDLSTKIAFIFPFQHFIGETPTLGGVVYYDMNEVPCAAPQGGFISPGLPGPKLPTKEEAFMEPITGGICNYTLGWVNIGPIEATNATQGAHSCTCPGQPTTCQWNDPLCTSCLVSFDDAFFDTPCRVSNVITSDYLKPYTPGWTGEVFILSPDSLSSSLLNTFGANSQMTID